MGEAGRYDWGNEVKGKGNSLKVKVFGPVIKKWHRLLPGGTKLSAFSFILSALFPSCHFNPDIQGKGAPELQGVWRQDSIPYQRELLQYTRHTFTFTCDSFYAEMQTFAKVNQYPEKCFNGGRWTEYARGTYERKGDSIFVNATFTQKNYKQKLTGCYRIGQYLPVFIVSKTAVGKMILQNTREQLPLLLNLKKTIVCQPKSL